MYRDGLDRGQTGGVKTVAKMGGPAPLRNHAECLARWEWHRPECWEWGPANGWKKAQDMCPRGGVRALVACRSGGQSVIRSVHRGQGNKERKSKEGQNKIPIGKQGNTKIHRNHEP